MLRSLRAQLVVSFFLVIVLVPILFFGLFFHTVDRYLHSNSSGGASSLLHHARAIANIVQQGVARGDPIMDLDELLRSTAEGTPHRFVLLDLDRNVLVDTAAPREARRRRPLSVPESDQVLLMDAPGASGGEGNYLRAAVPVVVGGRRIGALLVTRERHAPPFFHPLDWGLRTLMGILIAGAFSVLLTRRLFRPVDQLTRAAEAMAAGDLSQRVAVSSPGELGQLAERFNAMAARVEELVTTQAREHERLRAAHARLAESERRQRELIANVSHELRTPLAVIRASTEAILDGVADEGEKLYRCLRTIEEETVSLGRLIEDLLTLSRLDSGEMTIRSEAVDTRRLLERCVNRFRHAAEERGVALEADAPGDLAFLGDEERMAQVLSNLVENALHHTERGRVRLTAEGLGAHVVLRVSDTGRGIPPHALPHVFERLYRVEKSRSKGAGGAGLGLAIAREIVEAHDGDIAIESTPGQGTTVTIRLSRAFHPQAEARR
ncbi:MAG: ATP-binding protein [Armatimonadota bacterium]|jgi:signal transduction histidine kinase|nr:ATP-binding protein [Armatimonadota bacterium]